MNGLSKHTATLSAVLLTLAGLPGSAAAKFHIGLGVETVVQSEDQYRGAEQLIKEYGDVAHGGMCKLVASPDDFMSQQETYISNLVSLAEDPLMKVIVTNNMLPGTAEAYKRIRAKRPDILLLGGFPLEDPLVITQSADLAVDLDFVSRGYTIPWEAKQMGAKTLVHISFPRHMSYEGFGRRRAVMEQACKDLGLKFVFESAPDPTSDVGVAGAQQFLLEKVPQWAAQFGGPNNDKVAFFCTNDAQNEPVIKCVVAAKNALYPEPGSASPLMGFPGALGLNLADVKGDWAAIMKRIDGAIAAKGAAGRLGTTPYSAGFVFTAAMGELGKRVVEGKAKLSNPKDIFDALGKYTPGAKWSGTYYTDMSTGVQNKKELLVYMDTYVFGKGYMNTPSLKVPVKYATIQK